MQFFSCAASSCITTGEVGNPQIPSMCTKADENLTSMSITVQRQVKNSILASLIREFGLFKNMMGFGGSVGSFLPALRHTLTAGGFSFLFFLLAG